MNIETFTVMVMQLFETALYSVRYKIHYDITIIGNDS